MNWRKWLIDLGPAITVGAAAVAATAHGGYEVAVASRVPEGIAWLYPVITDGLALVAYAATRTLVRAGLAYAWTVVIVAAGLSGVAQAVYLASDALETSPELRFGVGAWPAVAGAVAAHLVFLLAHRAVPSVDAEVVAPEPVAEPVVDPEPVAEPVAPPKLRSVPAAKPAMVVSAPVDDLAVKVAAIVADGGGRGTVMRQLGLSENKARALVKQVQS